MVTISKVTSEDICKVKNLFNSIFADTYKESLSKETINKVCTLEHDSKNLELQSKCKNALFITAKNSNNTIVGVATANSINETINLTRLYVEKEYEDMDTYKLLLDYIIKEFPLINKIETEVPIKNISIINCYTENGFSKLYEKSESIENEVIDLLLMKKTIIRSKI